MTAHELARRLLEGPDDGNFPMPLEIDLLARGEHPSEEWVRYLKAFITEQFLLLEGKKRDLSDAEEIALEDAEATMSCHWIDLCRHEKTIIRVLRRALQ